MNYGCCREGDELLVRFHHKSWQAKKELHVSQSVLKMTDLLRDHYREMLDQAEADRFLQKNQKPKVYYSSSNW